MPEKKKVSKKVSKKNESKTTKKPAKNKVNSTKDSSSKKQPAKTETTVLYKGKTIPRGKQEKLRELKGSGSAGKYKGLAKKAFAGPAGGAAPGTYPINTLKRARNALARAHFAPKPDGIRKAVWKKWPELKKRFVKRAKLQTK